MIVKTHAPGSLHHRLDDHRGNLAIHGVFYHLQVVFSLLRARTPRGGRGHKDLFFHRSAPQRMHAAVGIAHAHRLKSVAVVARTPG